MLHLFNLLALSLGTITARSISSRLPDPSSCLAPVTFDGCLTLQSKVAECDNLPPDASPDEYAACYCTQEVFSAITDCESETRQCARSPNNDHYYEDIQSAWLSACGPKINFSPSTPVLSNYAFGTFSDLSCTSIAISACQSLQFLASQCSSFTDSRYYSCACRPNVVYQASLCNIFGSSCLGHVVTTSTLFIYRHCGFGQTTGMNLQTLASTTKNGESSVFTSGEITLAPVTSASITYFTAISNPTTPSSHSAAHYFLHARSDSIIILFVVSVCALLLNIIF